jgi:hypothetical protein
MSMDVFNSVMQTAHITAGQKSNYRGQAQVVFGGMSGAPRMPASSVYIAGKTAWQESVHPSRWGNIGVGGDESANPNMPTNAPRTTVKETTLYTPRVGISQQHAAFDTPLPSAPATNRGGVNEYFGPAGIASGSATSQTQTAASHAHTAVTVAAPSELAQYTANGGAQMYSERPTQKAHALKSDVSRADNWAPMVSRAEPSDRTMERVSTNTKPVDKRPELNYRLW